MLAKPQEVTNFVSEAARFHPCGRSRRSKVVIIREAASDLPERKRRTSRAAQECSIAPLGRHGLHKSASATTFLRTQEFFTKLDKSRTESGLVRASQGALLVRRGLREEFNSFTSWAIGKGQFCKRSARRAPYGGRQTISRSNAFPLSKSLPRKIVEQRLIDFRNWCASSF